MIAPRNQPAWRRHSQRERRLNTIRDELLAEAATLSRFDPSHRAINRAVRAIGTALRCFRDETG